MNDKAEPETLQQLKQRALTLLRQGDFSLAERLLGRGDATLQELTENLRIYQVELEAQAAELRESQQRLAATLDRFERLFQSLPLPALVTDLMGLVRHVNAAAARTLGLRQQRWGETSVFRCVAGAEDRTRLHAALMRAAETGAATLGEVQLTVAGPAVAVCDLFIERLARSESSPGSDELVISVIDQTERLQTLRQLRAANEELRHQQLENTRLAEVARLTGQLVVTTDAQRRITWVNEAFTRVTGYAAEEVIGRTPGRLLQGPGTDPAVVDRIAQRLALGLPVEHEEILNYTKDGRPYWLLLDIRPVRDAQGAVQQFVAVETDITERRRAEEALRASEERLRAVFDGEPNGVMVVQRDGRVREVNAAAARLLQAGSASQLLGQPATDFACDEDRPRMAALHQQVLLTGRAAELRCCIVGLQGGRRPIHMHSVPLQHGGGQNDGWLAIMRDLTQELEAERLRVEKNVAEEANRAKTQFLSRMSHELRTPLNAVLGFAQLLDGDLEHTPAAVQHERLGHIQRAGWQLLAMINDVLDLSRIESDQIALDMHGVPLAPAASAAVALVTPAAERRGLRLQVLDEAPGACAWADPVRLGQVLNNLMSNAVKYNRPEGWVELRIGAHDEQVTIEVSDSGPGLSAEQRLHLFEPFNRLGAERGGVEGTGIGLVIARRLVELMGGRIDVGEAPGGGACFRITLRAGVPDQAAPAVTAPSPPRSGRALTARRRRVLCVEDDPVNVEVVRAALEDDANWDLLVATDGAAALQAARAHAPELVLLDLQLPDMTGLEVHRQLKADPVTAGLPCILLTADATPATRAAAEASGFDRILLKPVSLAVLLGTILELLGEAAA